MRSSALFSRSVAAMLILAAANTLSAQSRVPGSSPTSLRLGSTERLLTITSFGAQLATRPMDLEKINCHLQSSANNIWVVTCETEDLPSNKPRVFVFDANRHDGSACELTVRYRADKAKWSVDVTPRLGARCAQRWIDDDHLEMRP